MSSGRESDMVSALSTKTTINGYEKLCGTDLLGLKESHYNHDDYLKKILEKFKRTKRRLVWNGVSSKRRKFTFG